MLLHTKACGAIGSCARFILIAAFCAGCASAGQDLAFVPNLGQFVSETDFVSPGSAYSISLNRTGVTLNVPRGSAMVNLVGSNQRSAVSALDPQPGYSNYLIGNDHSRWRTGIPHFSRVRYSDVYPGIDLIYYGNQRHLEYDFVISPKGNPDKIGIHLPDAEDLRINARGDLEFRVHSSDLRLLKPVAYQTIHGARKEVSAEYVLLSRNRVHLRTSGYDHHYPLIIDPVVNYATYLGGNADEVAYAVATDSNGDVYTAGYTSSANFPASSGVVQTVYGGSLSNAFVAKFSPAGALVYATYLGGNGADIAYGIAVDASRNAYITGSTSSSNFPTTAGSFSTSLSGNANAFVATLNAAGTALVYSTYLGGSGTDIAYCIALDSTNEATIAGSTTSPNFPFTGGSFSTSNAGGDSDAFVTRLSSSGAALVYSTYIGGSGADLAYGIAVDPQGAAYVTGYTNSADFPTTAGVAQTALAGDYDAFVTAVNSTGNALVYSTLLGGTGDDYGVGIALDSQKNAFITGATSSADYPVTTGVLQGTSAGGYDILLTRLSTSGTIVDSTLLGGSGDDFGLAIAVDSNGNAHITGDTASVDFPISTDALQSTTSGAFNIYDAVIGATGTTLISSTYLGGGGFETGYGIAIDPSNNDWVAGYTVSTDYPVTAANAFQSSLTGGSDALLIQFQPCQFSLGAPNISEASVAGSGNVSLTASPSGCHWTASSDSVWLTLPSSSGIGSATVNFSVTHNTGVARSGTLTVAGLPFTVNQAGELPQTISFAALSDVTFGVAPFTISATSDSGLTVSFASTTLSVCTVSGTTVTIVSGGPCSITASQPGDANYAPATPVVRGFTVNKATQTISFGTHADVAFGIAPFNLTASSTSGLTVGFASTTPLVCTVTSQTVTLVGAGLCSINATQTGNTSYLPAASVGQSFNVNKGSQTINFPALLPVSVAATPFALSATATSGLTVSFASTTTDVCTVSNGILSPKATGTCTVTASQGGNANYLAAPSVMQSFSINPPSNGGGGGGGGGGGAAYSFFATPANLTVSAPIGGGIVTQPVTLSLQSSYEFDSVLTYSASASTNQVQKWLSISPSSGTLSLVPGTTYTYAAKATISINSAGIPEGTEYYGLVNYLAAGENAGTRVTMDVTAPPPVFNTLPASLAFSYPQGDPTPPVQTIGVFSTPAGGTFSASVPAGVNWLTVTGSGVTPGYANVAVNASGLSTGTFSSQVAIIPSNGTPINIPVTLTVTGATPGLSVSSVTESLSTAQGGSPLSGHITVLNTGGGTLQFTAQTSGGEGTWLTLNAPAAGSATFLTPGTLGFKADPSGLSPGLYTGSIIVSDTGSSNQAIVPVILTVTGAVPSIQLSETGVYITAVAGGPQPPSQTLTVTNSGAGSLNWTAQSTTLNSSNWLQATHASGTTLTITADPTGLSPGQYWGSINVVSANASNSPQTVSVLLNVLAATASPGETLSSDGVILAGVAGSSTPAQQTITLVNPSTSAATFVSNAFTSDGGDWLSISPTAGTVSPGNTAISVAADLSKLGAGVQTGTVLIQFSDGSSATIQAVAVAASSAPTPASRTSHVDPKIVRFQALVPCQAGKPSFLIPVFQLPLAQSAAQVALPQTIQAEVLDDCGIPVTASKGGSVQVVFSSGDGTLHLGDAGNGIWVGTWTPVHAGTKVTLQIVPSEQGLAMNPSVTAGTTVSLSVQGTSASSPPSPMGGVANAAGGAQATPQVVAPGSYIAIYGTGLAGSGNPSATTLPLSTSLNGTQLLLGGVPMPLIYASSVQVNALVPQSLAPNASYPLIVVRGATQSVPVSLTVAELQPGIYTVDLSGSGPGIVTNALSGQLITSSNPAHAGDYLTVYCTGLGTLSGPNGETEPADGAAAPTDLVYKTAATVTATIGGVSVPASFAGLTPTLAALYQVNVQVPAGTQTGNSVPLVITATSPVTSTTTQSNTVSIAIQ